MRKIFVVAIREYLAAVKTKSFIISLILLPIMMSGGIVAQKFGQKFGDTSPKTIAIIDRTGSAVFDAISKAVDQHNENLLDENQRQVRANFTLEKIKPADLNDSAAVDRQRLELSNRVRSGELLAFVEIGPEVLQPQKNDSNPLAEIRYSTNRPTYNEFLDLLRKTLRPLVIKTRLGIAEKSDDELNKAEPKISSEGLAEKHEGIISYESKQGLIAPFIVPIVLVMLMFVVVIVGASPMTGNVIEEKQLRIAEVLLGSLRPFELMAGKLLGGVGVALTLAVIYFGGAYYVAFTQHMAGYISTGTILSFIGFAILGTLMYGSLFVAAGAAVTNIKEAQAIIMPVMLLIVLPLSLIGNIMQDPSGMLATSLSFFPFSAPMAMTVRIAVPPGVPMWEVIISAIIALLTTMCVVWAAGRIFRIGLLMQGQGANYAELMRWIVKG